MRSYLTHRLFRQLIHNAVYTDLRSRAIPLSYHCLDMRRPLPLSPPIGQRRFLFSFGKRKRQPKPVKYEPGFEAISLLQTRLRMEARPPEPDLLAKAFSEFIQFKREEARRIEGSSLEETQNRYVITTLQHLRKIYEGLPDFGLSSEDLRAGLFVLRRSSGERDESEMRIRLANLLFEELSRRRTAPSDEGEPARDDVSFVAELFTFIRILSRHCDALQARDLAEKYWKTDLVHAEQSPWGSVLHGMLREGIEEQVEKTLKIMQDFGIPFGAKIHQQIVTYHTQTRPDMDMTKRWYGRPISGGKQPTRHADAAVLRLCVQKDEFE